MTRLHHVGYPCCGHSSTWWYCKTCVGRPAVLKDHIIQAAGPICHCNWTCCQRLPALGDPFMVNGVAFQDRLLSNYPSTKKFTSNYRGQITPYKNFNIFFYITTTKKGNNSRQYSWTYQTYIFSTKFALIVT